MKTHFFYITVPQTPLFINCGTTKSIEKHSFFVYRLYRSAILHLTCNVFFSVLKFCGASMAIKNTAPWQTPDLTMTMRSKPAFC